MTDWMISVIIASLFAVVMVFHNPIVPLVYLSRLPGAIEVLGFPAGSYFTGKTASGTSVVYVTPGEGL